MDRILFSEQHDIFRSSFRQFVQALVLPNQKKRREQGIVDPEI